ncbi:NADH-quinone oxidoreductase subunit L [Rubripirellula tenax]|uniref:Probable inorganic carbon transporter subunit DabB n=1 Tax=Rubripirellula tenax TaxID=2528015 RepID=A0A5C6EFR8_9BACT|nr:proton-conducting transporter membrane subunit [Rubripirellula tenax]TWU47355.1 NADH-quinone oxidoreductase subunit L [Rubripirellula tenax]
MNGALLWMITLPAAGMVSFLLIPSAVANRHVHSIRSVATGLAAAQFLISVAAMLFWLASGGAAQQVSLFPPGGSSAVAVSLRYDGVSAPMLALVSFIGWVICRYSIRYLDGEATQGRYFRWTAGTIGAVTWMVISGNLLMFFAAWVATSMGLHHLLLHYPDRPLAVRAAWKKFAFSRLGDAALIGAIIIVYRQFGTFEFDQLFAAVEGLQASGQADATGLNATHLIGWLIMFGAVTKSAQLPFHSWLPLTMETPTPVSALMHAGIVNAGGYLIIRTSPLVASAPMAMTVLAIIGATTTCFAATVMLTQNSIKRSLAYSTIAQMGFMMLQCGLGAFSAAMLHILAHSLYKAHAFLASGSVIANRTATDVPNQIRQETRSATNDSGALASKLLCVAAAAIAIAIMSASMYAFGVSPSAKPGGYVMGFTLAIALTFWLVQTFATRKAGSILIGIATTIGLSTLYSATFFATDRLVSPFVPTVDSAPSWVVVVMVAITFVGMFYLSHSGASRSIGGWRSSLYVHATNGFYVDAFIRRIVGFRA